MDWSKIEEWLDRHPDQAQHYFMKIADVPLVNKWLQTKGYLRIPEGRNGGLRTSCNSQRPSPTSLHPMDRSRDPSPCSPASPRDRSATESVTFFGDELEVGHHRRTNSRKCLRHEYARAKSRSVVKAEESSGSRPRETDDCHRKRNDLKEMRKSVSLPPSSIGLLSLLIESKVQLPRCASKHRDLKRELRKRDEAAFFLDIVKDIANDLDLRSLTRKVKDNLTILLEADAASLFVVEEGKGTGKTCLVSKVFDVRCGAKGAVIPKQEGSESEVRLPWGAGVLGYVAESGETVNLESPCEDSRYCDAVDRLTGYHVDSLLCMPIRNADDDVIAVAQVMNKIGPEERFTLHDEKLFETYLQFVCIAITNAKIMEASRREYERNRSLLEAVHELFDKQTSLEALIQKTLQEAHRLLACEKATILLLKPDQESGFRFTKAFEVTSAVKKKLKVLPDARSIDAPLLRIAEQVASNGEIIATGTSSADSPPSPVVAVKSPTLRSVLAMPIRNTKLDVIGVAMLVNKVGVLGFDDFDEQLFEALTIFCGLGINNTLMYCELEQAIARQRVAIEMLSYHALSTQKEVESLLEIRSSDDWKLKLLSFDDFSLSHDEMAVAAVTMFTELGLVHAFRIDAEVLYRWILTVKRNYRAVPYHNWRHSFSVAQTMFAMLQEDELRKLFSDLQILGIFVACFCHDLDHRGTNNAFQEKTGSALALLYGTKNTMEQHHFNHAVMILNSEGHNIFANLEPDDYSAVMCILKHAILATDLCIYFQFRDKFAVLIESDEPSSVDWSVEENLTLLRSVLMTAADLATSTKAWDVQRKAAARVTAEFFRQGDVERNKLNIVPHAQMDRERGHELPSLQVNWLQSVCLPLYKSVERVVPSLSSMREAVEDNIDHWKKLVEGEEEYHWEDDLVTDFEPDKPI